MPALHSAAVALAAALSLAALAGVTWDGDVVWEPVVRDVSQTDSEGPRDTPVYTRETLTFPMNGGGCRVRGSMCASPGEGRLTAMWAVAGAVQSPKDGA